MLVVMAETARVTACDSVCTDVTQARSQHKRGVALCHCVPLQNESSDRVSHTVTRCFVVTMAGVCHCHCASVHTQRRSHTASHTSSHNSRSLCPSRHDWGLSVTARLFHCVRLHSDTVTFTHCVTRRATQSHIAPHTESHFCVCD